MSNTDTSKKTTFHGSCHCGAIRYEVHVALPDPPVASRCNCTFCQKRGYTSLPLASRDDFILKSPASFSDTTISDYQHGDAGVHRYFCKNCGVQFYSYGSYPWEGKVVHFQSINVASLDQPQEGLDLSQWKMQYVDGRADNWMSGTKDVPWSGGLV